jgi:hypothetical protein
MGKKVKIGNAEPGARGTQQGRFYFLLKELKVGINSVFSEIQSAFFFKVEILE